MSRRYHAGPLASRTAQKSGQPVVGGGVVRDYHDGFEGELPAWIIGRQNGVGDDQRRLGQGRLMPGGGGQIPGVGGQFHRLDLGDGGAGECPERQLDLAVEGLVAGPPKGAWSLARAGARAGPSLGFASAHGHPIRFPTPAICLIARRHQSRSRESQARVGRPRPWPSPGGPGRSCDGAAGGDRICSWCLP